MKVTLEKLLEIADCNIVIMKEKEIMLSIPESFTDIANSILSDSLLLSEVAYFQIIEQGRGIAIYLEEV